MWELVCDEYYIVYELGDEGNESDSENGEGENIGE